MSDTTTKAGTTPLGMAFGLRQEVPVLLLAHAPEASYAVDRCLVSMPFVLGRASDCTLSVADEKLSKNHLRITRDTENFYLEDLGSTNGTFLEGARVAGKAVLESGSVIRAGRCVLVFLKDGSVLLDPPPSERYGMAGRFHTGPLLVQLREAADSQRHVLLGGPSGAGKELAARAIWAMLCEKLGQLPFVVHNAARFTSEEEAASTLFGVGDKVFSSVAARPGLIERASGGVLFLDEIHNLPSRVQRTLLRVLEDGELSRIGEQKQRAVNVRFVLASNEPTEHLGLASDLFARLRLVNVPPLSERVADIASVFKAVLDGRLRSAGLEAEPLTSLLGADHYEALCLDRLEANNVRGLLDLADRIATRAGTGMTLARALTDVFADRFADGLVAQRHRMAAGIGGDEDQDGSSHYEKHKDAIIAAIRECGGNLSAAERLLKSRDIRSSRRWLSSFARKWRISR